MKKLLLLFLLCLVTGNMAAQLVTPCIDPARVNPWYMCNDPLYNPVCGCDKKTYRNACNAQFVNGVTTYVSGVCSGLDVDIFPNPVLSYEPFTVNLSYTDNILGNVSIKIMDVYNKVLEQRSVYNFNRTMIQFDVSAYSTGVYILIVESSLKTGAVKKFSVY